MSGAISHALPLALCASLNYPLPSSPFDSGNGGYFLPRVKLADIPPEDGPPSAVYTKVVKDILSCLSRHGAAILELSVEDSALVRCALESTTLYFFTRAQMAGSAPSGGAGWSKTSDMCPLLQGACTTLIWKVLSFLPKHHGYFSKFS